MPKRQKRLALGISGCQGVLPGKKQNSHIAWPGHQQALISPLSDTFYIDSIVRPVQNTFAFFRNFSHGRELFDHAGFG
jgi:hypothetical protein